MELVVSRLSPDNVADFWALMARDEHEGAVCWCTAWWTDTWEEYQERTPEQRHAFRESLFERGEYDGYLAYADGAPVAWMQVGPRDRLPKLVANFDLEPDPETWATSCFLVLEPFRGQGLGREFLRLVVAVLDPRGVMAVEGYARHGTGHEATDLWSGPESVYADAGFTEAKKGPYRSVYRRG
jgi:GNAT superfamily N-acetyltransferase